MPQLANGLPSDTIGVVNNQSGLYLQRINRTSAWKTVYSGGKKCHAPQWKKARRLCRPKPRAKALMNRMPKFKNGIGEFFGNASSKVKDFTGDVMDYITHPGRNFTDCD